MTRSILSPVCVKRTIEVTVTEEDSKLRVIVTTRDCDYIETETHVLSVLSDKVRHSSLRNTLSSQLMRIRDRILESFVEEMK